MILPPSPELDKQKLLPKPSKLSLAIAAANAEMSQPVWSKNSSVLRYQYLNIYWVPSKFQLTVSRNALVIVGW